MGVKLRGVGCHFVTPLLLPKEPLCPQYKHPLAGRFAAPYPESLAVVQRILKTVLSYGTFLADSLRLPE